MELSTRYHFGHNGRDRQAVRVRPWNKCFTQGRCHDNHFANNTTAARCETKFQRGSTRRMHKHSNCFEPELKCCILPCYWSSAIQTPACVCRICHPTKEYWQPRNLGLYPVIWTRSNALFISFMHVTLKAVLSFTEKRLQISIIYLFFTI